MSGESAKKRVRVEIIGSDDAIAGLQERLCSMSVVGETFTKALNAQIASVNSRALEALNESIKSHVRVSEVFADSVKAHLAISDSLAKSTTAMFERLRPSLERFREMWEHALPPNWREFEETDRVSRILEFMEETGLALAWVPRPAVIAELLKTTTDEARAAVLRSHEAEVLDDLVACLEEIGDSDLLESRETASEAVQCYRDTRARAAQALATNLFSTLIHVNLELDNFGAARAAFTRDDPMKVSIARFRLVAILRTAGRAIERYTGRPGEPIPTVFNRHASTHRVCAIQYTRLNSLTSLMLVVSLLRELEFWAGQDDESG